MPNADMIPLAEVALPQVEAFVDGPFGSNLKAEEYVDQREVRLVQLQNIGIGEWLDAEAKYISHRKARSLARHVAFPGDIVIAKMADPVARACILPPGDDSYIVVADCIKLQVDRARFEPAFIARFLNSNDFRRRAEALSTGTTRLRINLTSLKQIGIPALGLNQQRRIAEILNTLDSDIHESESLIAKLRLIRSSAHRKLVLTPKSSWRSVRLHEVVKMFSGGTPSTSDPQYWEGDIPWISAASLKSIYIWSSNRNLTALGASAGTRLVPSDTILVIVRGMSLKKELRIGITMREVAFGQDCKALVAAPGYSARFIMFALMAHAQQILEMVDEAGHGTGRLPTDLFSNLMINVPEIDEQERIAAILDSLYGRGVGSSQIAQEEARLSKLNAVKQGLMDDLLTGRVRVPGGAMERMGTG